MGAFDGDKEIKKNSNLKLKIGPRGLQGPPGKDGKSILPKNLLKTTGFTMAGSIDMNLNAIKKVKYQSDLNDCCPKSYIDNGRTILPADNITASNANFSNDIRLNGNKIRGVLAGNLADDVVTKAYVNNFKFNSNNYLKLDGSNSMLDDLDMGDKRIIYVADLIANSDAINLRKTNDLIANATSNLIKRTGDLMFGTLNLNNNRISNLTFSDEHDAVTKKYTDDNFILKSNNDYIKKYLVILI